MCYIGINLVREFIVLSIIGLSKEISVAVFSFPFRLDFPSQILQDKQFFIEIIQAQMNNSELISEILHLHGELLRYTCEKIKDDKSMVSRAIGSHCSALKHASKRLKEDCDLRFQALHSCASNGCYCIMIELIHDCSDSSVP